MAYTPVFSQGVKFIKIARVDDQGKDNTLSLQELNSVRIDYSDVGIVEYPITSISKYDTYFLFGVAPTDITSSTDNEILNYRSSASYIRQFNSGSSYVLSNFIPYGTESYNDLGYFDMSTGKYTLGNQPNIPITITVSASVTASADATNILYINSNINNVVASRSILYEPSSGFSQSIMIASYTAVPELNEYFQLSFSPGSTSQFTGSFYITQSINPIVSSSDLVVLQPYIDENFAISDYNVLAGDALESRVNPFYMDVDYNDSAITASNQQAILSGSATRATVQESNYTDNGWVNARYYGTKVSSINYNNYTSPTDYTTSSTSIFGYDEYWPGDQAYGKQASIDVYRNYFAKFINITSSTPEIIGGSKIYITELIDINGNIFPLGQDEYTLTVAYNFTTGTDLSIYNIINTSASLFSSASVIDGGAYYQTILSSTGSSITASLPTFATFIKNPLNNNLVNIDGTNAYYSSFTASAPNVLSAVNSNNPTVLKNWLYGFLTSSFQGEPLYKINIYGDYASVYNKNTNSNVNGGVSGSFNTISDNDIITPIQSNDYIRIGTTGSDFNTSTPITSSQTFQITNAYINPSADGLYTGSLTLNGTIINLPNPLSQAYIIYRRVSSDSYITINKEINSNSSGLIIPANFNPNYDPIAIARRVGII
jgi:hypothetical protein